MVTFFHDLRYKHVYYMGQTSNIEQCCILTAEIWRGFCHFCDFLLFYYGVM